VDCAHPEVLESYCKKCQPGVGVRWPVELGRGKVWPWPWLWRWLSGWPSVCEWLLPSRGGEIGSLLIFTGSGDVEGGGVLLDTAKW